MKALQEIKGILKKFPKASNAGFVVFPSLATLAHQLGLPGYDEALHRFIASNLIEASGSVSTTSPVHNLFISWEGPAIRFVDDKIIVGLEETLRQVELTERQVKPNVQKENCNCGKGSCS